MKLAIDWFSTILFLSVYAFARIPAVPLRVGNLALAAACGVIAVYRFRMGTQGPNLIFVGIAVALGIYYLMRGLRTFGGPRSPPPSER